MFPQAISRLEQAVFDRLGEDATWQGVTGTVRIRRVRDGDQQFRLQYGELIVDAAVLAVRQSEVAAPAQGDSIQILAADGNDLADGAFTVAADPRLDRKKGVWLCQVKPAA